jgi:hypothetical protein
VGEIAGGVVAVLCVVAGVAACLAVRGRGIKQAPVTSASASDGAAAVNPYDSGVGVGRVPASSRSSGGGMLRMSSLRFVVPAPGGKGMWGPTSNGGVPSEFVDNPLARSSTSK